MGYRRAPEREEINRLAMQIVEIGKSQGIAAAFEAAKGAAQEYPDSGTLLFTLAATLEGRMMMAGMTQAERAPYQAQLLAWYERASQGEDEEIREASAHLLASKALARGDTDTAQCMMERLPREPATARWPLEVGLMLEKGEEAQAQAHLQKRLLRCAGDLQQMLLRLEQTELDAGETDRAKAIAHLMQRFVELMCMQPYIGHLAMLLPALREQDVQQCITHIRGMLLSLEQPWNPGECLFYERVEIKKGGYIAKDMLAGVVREMEESEEYAFLRDNVQFRAILADYACKERQN